MKLAHFYHIYADGDYEGIVQQHLQALFDSDLYDNLDLLAIGVVGERENRIEALELLDYYKVQYELAAMAETGWEQVTIEALHDFAHHDKARVLYAHTKGAWSRTDMAELWRETMTHAVVDRWQECVEALNAKDTAGAYWIISAEPEHINHSYFYGGNFWWANTDYLRTLPPVGTDTRFQAEGWIGLGHPTTHVTWPGYPFWGNFLRERIP